MTSPYVCLRCQSVFLARGHRVRRASFVSLGKLVEGRKKQPLPTECNKDAEGKTLKPQSTRYPARRTGKHRDPYLESLFSNSIRQKDITFDQQSTGLAKKVQPVYIVPARKLIDEHIQTLEHLLNKQRVPLVELWKACQELLGSSTWQQMVSDAGQEDIVFSATQLNVFRDILLQIAFTRSRYPKRIEITLVSNAVKAYRRHNIMKSWWDQVLLKQLLGYISLTPSYSREAFPKEDPSIVLKEIIEVWRLLVHEYGEPAGSSTVQPKSMHSSSSSLVASLSSAPGGGMRWGRLPSKTLDAEAHTMPLDISQRFSEHWPRRPGASRQTNRMIIASIMTYDILECAHRQGFMKDSTANDAKTLLRYLTPLLQEGEVKLELVMTCLKEEGISKPIAERITQGWRTLPISVIGTPASEDSSNAPQAAPLKPQSTPTLSDAASKLINALRSATKKTDAALVRSLWQKFKAQIDSNKIEGPSRDVLFSRFLSAFFTNRRHAEAVEVWNFMVATNHQPTLKHWHAMLAGCTAAKDLTSLRVIRNNMLSAGVQSDLGTWTTWIHGLMACGDWQSGLRALEDLGNVWKPASFRANESSQGRLKPSLVPVRAALAGLAQSDNMDVANAVLTWAQKQNLSLDTQIYNNILRPPARANNEQKVQSVLQDMHAKNCRPDIATFTIILNGLLSGPSSTFHTRPPQEQQSAVLAILDEMERNGLKANTYTYSTILDGLLDPKIFNVPAAQAVIEHMTKNNIRPSPHVYTILTKHFFSLSPPDLAAIDTLLHRTRLEKTPLDPIFWDRMIESYAQVGETEKMLLTLRRMPQQGQSPGWMALLACLKALVEQQEWENVRELVRDVEDVNGVLRHGNGPWKGKDAFWELVGEVRMEGRLGDGEEP